MTEQILFYKLKGWQPWDVAIRNTYSAGRYASVSTRAYTVIAGSADEACSVVLHNATAILDDFLTKKTRNNRRILPAKTAMPITARAIAGVQDSSIICSGVRNFFTPDGIMCFKIINYNIA
jgi:hypothetical protein